MVAGVRGARLRCQDTGELKTVLRPHISVQNCPSTAGVRCRSLIHGWRKTVTLQFGCEFWWRRGIASRSGARPLGDVAGQMRPSLSYPGSPSSGVPRPAALRETVEFARSAAKWDARRVGQPTGSQRFCSVSRRRLALQRLRFHRKAVPAVAVGWRSPRGRQW